MQLSSDAGPQLLKARESELRSATDEFNGHCLT
jgi:hypothetical protein